MMLIFELRAKIAALYQRYDYWFNLAFRFVLLMIAYGKLNALIGYNASLSSGMIRLVISLVSAFLPPSLAVLVAVLYSTLQVMSQSTILAVLLFMLFIICYCFFLRFAPKYGEAVIAMPTMQALGFPYALPLVMGLFGNLLTIVPVCCGVVAYYTLHTVADYITELKAITGEKPELQELISKSLDKLLKNPTMYVVMLIMAVVIVTVYFIRRINMDYSFEISVAVGTGVMMLGYIIGDLRYDMGIRIAGMVITCGLCAGACLVLLFFTRVLQYSAAEHVEFEDDDYFYYVKAIPKIKVGMPKRKERKVIKRRRDEEEDDDEEYEEAALGLIDYSNRTAKAETEDDKKPKAVPIPDEDDDDDDFDDLVKPAAVSDKDNSRKPIAADAAGGLFEDEDDEDEDGTKRVGRGRGKKGSGNRKKSNAVRETGVLPGKDISSSAAPAGKEAAKTDSNAWNLVGSKPASAAPAASWLDDDDDDEDEQVIHGYFEGDAAAPAEPLAATPSTLFDDDDDDDEDEQVIHGYFESSEEESKKEAADDDEDYL